MYEAQTTEYDNILVGENNITAEVLVVLDDSSAPTTIPKGTIVGYDGENFAFSCSKRLTVKTLVTLEDVIVESASARTAVKVLVSGEVDVDKLKNLDTDSHKFVKFDFSSSDLGIEGINSIMVGNGNIVFKKTI